MAIQRDKTFGQYLDEEYSQGKTEFRLVVVKGAPFSFYIHPLGKDGQTLDANVDAIDGNVIRVLNVTNGGEVKDVLDKQAGWVEEG